VPPLVLIQLDLSLKSDEEVTVEEVTVDDEVEAVLEVAALVGDGQGDGTSVGPLPLEGWKGAQ
jgi:hypothetical protein